MAIGKANGVQNVPLNTGSDDSVVMLAPAMLIAVPRTGFSFTLAQVANPITWITPLIHGALGSRVYPLFGYNVPIRDIKNNAGESVVEKLEDGVPKFVRFDVLDRTFVTTEGGESYARILQSFVNMKLDFIEIDVEGNIKCVDNGDGTYKGMTPTSIVPANPTLADFKSVFKSMLKVVYKNENYVLGTAILAGGLPLLTQIGLKSVQLTSPTASTTTKLRIGATVITSGADLVAALEAAIAQPTAYVVTKVSDGTVVTISGGAIVNGVVELTGTFTSASSYLVTAVTPTQLLALSTPIIGFEFTNSVTILIP